MCNGSKKFTLIYNYGYVSNKTMRRAV